MKEKLTEILLLIVSIAAIIWGAYTLGKGQERTKIIEKVNTVEITDIQYDTIYLTRYDTMEYYNYDTLCEAGEIILKTDTLKIPVPISTSAFDTTVFSDEYETQIIGQISGFHTSLDLLTINTQITRHEERKRLKLVPSLGIGYGTGGFGFFVGIGVTMK